MELVSICISTWNRVADLKLLFESILKQDYFNLELCIVDNASLDGTFKLVQEYKQIFNGRGIEVHYELLPAPNDNAIQTINQALRMGTGKYLLIVDDDAYLYKNDVISRLASHFSNPYVGIVGANIRGQNGLAQLMIANMDGNVIPEEDLFSMGSFEYYNFHGACAMFRKDVMQRLHYYDESFVIYMNELDIALRCISIMYKVLIDMEAIVIHKGTVDMNACTKKAIFAIRNYNRCIRRNFSGLLKWKCLTLQTIMTFGYFAERIIMWDTYKKRCIFPLIYRTILYNLVDFTRRQPKNSGYSNWIIQRSIYNRIKKSFASRIGWSLHHKQGIRGFK
jgi:GT2 family glycosyltransferase